MYLKHTRWIALFILGSVLLAACGGSSGTTSPGQATSAPVAPTTPALEPTAAAPGGAGGDLNQNGENGHDSSYGVSYGTGGAHGDYAVQGNSHITWIDTGTILGAVT